MTLAGASGSDRASRKRSKLRTSLAMRSGRETPSLTSISTGSAAAWPARSTARPAASGAARSRSSAVGPPGSSLGDVPALPVRRIDDDAHPVAAGRVDEDLARRAEAGIDRAGGLSAPRSGCGVRPLGGTGSVALPLDRDGDDQERPEAEELEEPDHADAGQRK